MALSQRTKGGNWYWRETIKGIEFMESTGTTKKPLAKEWAAKRHEEAYRNIELEGHKRKPLTVKVLIEKYLASVQGKTTYRNIELNLSKFSKHNDTLVKNLSRDDIQAVVNAERAKGNGEGTIALMSRYWNTCVNFGIEQELFAKAPKLPTVKKPPPKKRHLTEQEEDALLKALDPTERTRGWNPQRGYDKQNNYDLVICLLETGARYNEIADLTWSQIDLAANTVFIRRSKGGTDFTVFMTDRLLATIKARHEAREDDDWVFPSKQGRYKESTWMKRAVTKAGISDANGTVTLHAARRTFATRMDADGFPIQHIQKMLGHRDVRTTEGYIDSNPSEIAKAAHAAQQARAARKAQPV